MAIRIGSFWSNKLRGTAYDDYISDVLGGNDSLYGFAGNDFLESKDLFKTSNLLDGGEGHDTLSSYGGSHNTLIGGTGNDFLKSRNSQYSSLEGGYDSDRLESYADSNTLLRGDEGDDILYSYYARNNVLKGGEGNDEINTVGGTNVIYSDFGQDRINSGGTDLLIGEYQHTLAPILLNVDAPNSGNGIIIGAFVNTSFSAIESFKFFGGQFDDTLVAGNGDDTLDGGAGNDILNGQAGNNTILGQAGDDTILSIEAGFISGGMGNDFMLLREGNFEVNGNGDNDIIFMLEATGNVNGGDGFDLLGINYQNSTFPITMEYYPINQSGYLKSNNRQVLFTDIEQLEIFGSLGSDRLVGTNNSDLLNGNVGIDTLVGGLGADLFRFFKPNNGTDILTDFDVTEDRIELVTEGSPIVPQFPQLGLGEFKGLTITATQSLALEQFTIDTNATDSNHRIIYNSGTGALFYDPDGVGDIEQVQFAHLNPHLVLTPSNFVIR